MPRNSEEGLALKSGLGMSVFSATEEALQGAVNLAQLHQVPRGDFIVTQGDEDDDVYVLVSGNAKVVSLALDGKQVWLDAMGPGSLIGEMTALTGEPRSATVVAAAPVVLARFSAQDFICLLTRYGAVAVAVARLMAARVANTSRRFAALRAEPTIARLYRELFSLSGEADAEGWRAVTARLSHTDLAERVVSNRETVSRSLEQLDEMNYLRREGNRLAVKDNVRLGPLATPASSGRS